MVWRRLPSFLPNIPIRLLPFTEAQQKEFEASGHLRTVAFRTIPSLSKVRWHQYAHGSQIPDCCRRGAASSWLHRNGVPELKCHPCRSTSRRC